jgi:glucokinase
MAVLGVAGPIDGDRVALTNRAWSFSRQKLQRRLKLKQLIVVNDFAAVALALPFLKAKDVLQIGGGKADAHGNLLACGPGTGFGVAVLVRAGHYPFALSSEAGHMVLGAASADETQIFQKLLAQRAPLAVEDVLSGPGLARLHRAVSGQELNPDQILAAARVGEKNARSTTDIFFRLMGRIAGDLALAFDARGGVYIAGGLGRALAPFFAASRFRESFENHVHYRERLVQIPIHVIVHPAPGLLGALMLAGSKTNART